MNSEFLMKTESQESKSLGIKEESIMKTEVNFPTIKEEFPMKSDSQDVLNVKEEFDPLDIVPTWFIPHNSSTNVGPKEQEILETSSDIKEEFLSDNDTVSSLEEATLEICKTELIYDETTASSAKRIEDSSQKSPPEEMSSLKNYNKNNNNFSKRIEDKCVACGQKFDDLNAFIEHAKLLHPKVKAFKCRECDACFTSILSVSQHRVKHKNVPKPCVCDICSKAFPRITKLKIHLRTHTGERPFVCTFCGQMFQNKAPYVIHKNKHWELEPNECLNADSKCGVCKKDFTCQQDLIRHAKQQHPKEKALKCRNCGRPFVNMESVSSHICYGFRKEYICEYCSLDCQSKFRLDCHLRVHTGDRPYSCSVCGRTFKYVKDIVRHCAKAHNSEYLNTSDKRFKNQSNAKEIGPMETERNVSPYKFDSSSDCGKTVKHVGTERKVSPKKYDNGKRPGSSSDCGKTSIHVENKKPPLKGDSKKYLNTLDKIFKTQRHEITAPLEQKLYECLKSMDKCEEKRNKEADFEKEPIVPPESFKKN